MTNIINLKQFPTTRYQGSKRKILPWIYNCLKDLSFNSVLDACGGSSSVSYLFKKMNKHVTYNDNLKFNSIIGKAIIENQNVKFCDQDLKNILTNNNSNYPNFIQSTFKNIYYLNNENKWLDKMSHEILNMNHYSGNILEFKKALAYYALFQACIIKRPFNLFHRNNLNIRTNDVERNFGNKTTWDKSFNNHFKSFIKEANSLIFDSGTICKSINKSILEIDDSNYDLVYIDPPYLNINRSNESSNYLNCYHFLEGIVNYKSWASLINYESNNLRFHASNKDNVFELNNIFETYENIFYKFRKSIIVLSYKQGGKPSISYLVKLMKKHKRNVSSRSIEYTYALNRQNGDAKNNREILIIGT